jgi:hypothetical protein
MFDHSLYSPNSQQTQIDNVKRSNDNSNKIEKDNNHRPQMLIYSTENQEQSMDDSITHIKTVHYRQTLKGDFCFLSTIFPV